jgi:hypothetical protein
MADYSAAQITIGGWISRRIVPRLCHLVRQQRLSLDWGAASFEPRSNEELLGSRSLIDGELVLRLCDEQAPYGEFDALESFLCKQKIPFDRRAEGHFSYPPQFVTYRPRTGHQRWLSTNDGEIVMPALPVWEAQEMMHTLHRMAVRGPRVVLRERLRQALDLLHEALPPRPSPLPPLEIGRSVALRDAA